MTRHLATFRGSTHWIPVALSQLWPSDTFAQRLSKVPCRGDMITPFKAHFTDEESETFPLDLSFRGRPQPLPRDQGPVGHVDSQIRCRAFQRLCSPCRTGPLTDASSTPQHLCARAQMEIHVTRPARPFHFSIFKSFLFYRGWWKGWKVPGREEVGGTYGRAIALLREPSAEGSPTACRTSWAGHSCFPVNHSLPSLIPFSFSLYFPLSWYNIHTIKDPRWC